MILVFGIGSVIYTGIEIGVHLEPGLSCVDVTTVLRYYLDNYLGLNAVSERMSLVCTKM